MMQSRWIRVLHIIDHLGLGGAQTFVLDLVLEQSRSGLAKPAVCCLTERTALSHQFTRCGVPLYHLGVARRNPFEIGTIPLRLLWLIRSHGCRLVHTHLFVSGVFGRLAAMMAGVPAVIQEQRNETAVAGSGRRWIDHLLARRTGAVICVSETTKAFNVHDKGVDPDRIWVIPNGIDLERFSHNAARTERHSVLRALQLLSADRIVIGVGRLERQKRFDIFLRAAQIVSKQVANVGFVIVGDGPDRETLKGLSAQLGLSQTVRFTGARSDVPRLLGISDVFVLTSDFEGLPLTLLEALAMQVPAVATDVDGAGEVLRKGRGGILVPSGNPIAVASAVVSLLGDDERRRSIGEQGRRLLEREYSIRIVNEQVAQVYGAVLRRNGCLS